MPHIDDGTLHALLDGALRAMEPAEADAVETHLEACAECRARLEQAAALRGRAGEILGVLEPAVAPDFEEVLVRAGGRQGGAASAGAAADAAGRPDRLRRQLHWTRGLAWAATLVIALGTGYLIRDRLGPEGTAELMQPSADRVEEAAADIARPGSGDRSRAQDGTTDGTAEVPVEADADDAGLADGARPGGAVADVRPATPVVTEEEESARSRSPGRGVAAPDVPVREDDDPIPATGAEAAPEPRLEIAAPAEALKMGDAAAPPATFMALTPRDTSGLRVVAPAAVRELAGTPLAVIPDAEIVQVWVAPAPAGRIVSTQRLGDGAVVRVVQQRSRIALEEIVVTSSTAGQRRQREAATPPPAEAAEAPQAAQAGMNRFETGGILGYELILEGPLDRERLRALADAAREAWLRASLVRPNP